MKLLTYRTKKEALEAISDFEDIDIVDHIYNERNEIVVNVMLYNIVLPLKIGNMKWVIGMKWYNIDCGGIAYLTENEKWINFIPEKIDMSKSSPVVIAKYRKKTKTDVKKAEALVKRCIKTGETWLDLSKLRIDRLPESIIKCGFIKTLDISGTSIMDLDEEVFGKFYELKQLCLQRSLIISIPDSILRKPLMLIEVSRHVKYSHRLANENKIAVFKV